MDAGIACSSQTQPSLCTEILSGLGCMQKRLPPKLFYDATGSRLFDAICELPEYYVTRTEMQIMTANIDEICAAMNAPVKLVEFGSGSSLKTELLLTHLRRAVYVPIDISREHLMTAAERLRGLFPQHSIHPLVADFTQPICLPADIPALPSTTVFFPGSTLGNFDPADARRLLRRIRNMVGDDGGLLLGIDLRKDVSVLEAAYNDSAGVTAAFNLNLLERLNREFEADFRPQQFLHRAHYNARRGRIEMHLYSRVAQRVSVLGRAFDFAEGETLHTENSYKYSSELLDLMARSTGFRIENQWTDPRSYFAVQHWVAV